ncbi:MAG: diguanylate cyclase [Pseudomonadota bacterium]
MKLAVPAAPLQLLRRIGIRYRLIGSFVLLSLLPLVMSGYISYTESSGAIEERARLFSTEVVKQVSKNIQLQMSRFEDETERMMLSDQVQGALAQYAGGGETAQSAAKATLTRALLEHYGAAEYVNQKYFLDKDNKIMDSQVFAQLGRGIVAFVERAPKLAGRPYWGTYTNSGGQNSIVLLRALYNKDNNALVGNLFLGVQPTHFSDIFDGVNLGNGTDILVLDVNNAKAIVGSPEAPLEDLALAGAVAAGLHDERGAGFVAYNSSRGGNYRAAYSRVPGTSWCVVSTIPLNKLTAEAKSVRDKIMLIGLLCFLLAIGVSLVIARSISHPLDQLVQSMRETESGNYAQRMRPEGRDELTVLAHKFNEMASRVDQNQAELESKVEERTRDLFDANNKLAALSMTDGLTGIANRRRLDDTLLSEIKRATRSKKPLALMMLDVDFFKNFNDHYGHLEGDACLQRIAQLLQSHSRRASDLAARYGGEEFVLVAADTDGPSAMALAENIRRSLAVLRLPHARSLVGFVTASIGVAVVVPHESMTPDTLVRMADQAMYRAKAGGRNQVVMAADETADA